MNKRGSLFILILLIGFVVLTFHIQTAKGIEPITIKANGKIDPEGLNITTDDNSTYTFTGNVLQPIDVQRSNIVLDGEGWAVIGSEYITGAGIRLTSVNNVTVRSTNITQCLHGIYLDSSSYNNTLSGNIVWESRYYNAWGIYLDSSHNNTLSGNIVYANRYGIWLKSSYDNWLLNNTATGNSQDGIDADSSFNNTFQDNNVSGNHNYGLYLQSSFNNTLLKNNVAGNNWTGIYLDSSYNNTFQDNNVSGNHNTATDTSIGIVLANSNGNNITGNNITANQLHGVYCSAWNNTVRENNITENGRDGVFLFSGTNTVYANNITANGQDGICLESPNNTVRENNITENDRDGVFLLSGTNTVYANNITANGQDGICLESPNNTVYANNIAANNASGVYLMRYPSNTIYGNNITTNRVYGAYLEGSSNNMIHGNNITNNRNIGIWIVSESDGNMIYGNNILENSRGVDLEWSYNNKVYHNNFNGNPPLVSSSESTKTAWDYGYPSSGNYWSDYLTRYPNAQEVDGSGIGDTPYVIDANNTDSYPLISAHYVVVTNITTFKTVVGENCCMNISATVSNFGTYDENVNLTLFANSTLMNQAVITLNTTQSLIITLTCNVSGCVLYDHYTPARYTLTANASLVSEGTSFLEHNCTGPCFVVAHVGDITGGENNLPDGKINQKDISYIASRFGADPTKKLWDPNADLNNDGVIDMKDISLVGQAWHPI